MASDPDEDGQEEGGSKGGFLSQFWTSTPKKADTQDEEGKDGGDAPAAKRPATRPATSAGRRPAVSTSPQATPAPHRAAPVSVPISSEVQERIDGLFADAAHPAYSQFLKMDAGMQAVLPDEGTRVRSVLVALATNNVTVAAVMKDVEECRAALDKAEAESNQAAEQKIAEASRQHEGEVAKVKQEIDSVEADIRRLEERLTGLVARRDELEQQGNRDAEAVRLRNAEFSAAIALRRTELETKARMLGIHGKGM